jgi:hypothetical protein
MVFLRKQTDTDIYADERYGYASDVLYHNWCYYTQCHLIMHTAHYVTF